jgi:hypothetical protein
MSTVGWSTLDVIPSVKNLRSQLEAQTSRDFAAAGKKGGQQFGDAAGKEASGRIKSHFAGIGKDILAPIAGLAAGAAIVDFFKGAIGGASDLAESGNKVKVIFGDATAEIDKFASRGAKAFGQTKLEVLNAASDFGVFGKAAGLSGEGLAEFSEKLAGLSTDLASFFNTSPAQAVQAIGAGLRGESEPLRQFGVLLDDATLRQEALRQGLVSTTQQALTPQQRVLAAYNVILKQTKDAQGDFERTSGGLANQQRILSAQWSEMTTELGSHLLPAATATVKAFNDGVLPTMERAGGVAGDLGSAFGNLPTPIKAATGALVAFKIAQATGVTGQIASGFDRLGSGLTQIETRAKNAASAFKTVRSELFVAGRAGAEFSGSGTRIAASLEAIRAASFGAGAGLQRGLKGALSLVGGPWGAAFIAGTAVVAHFWQEHQRAKQRVEDFTATLDKETGALTENSREFVAKELAENGVLKSAQNLGLSLSLVTDAALGQWKAISAVNSIMAAKGELDTQAAADAIKVKQAIDGTNSVIGQSVANQRLFATALGLSNTAADGTVTSTGRATTATSKYAGALDKARQAVQKLLDKENERRNRNLGAFQDQTRLAQALADARKEAADGAKTLDANSEAGRKNRDSLASLADAWNSAAGKVKNADGAYATMRDRFIQVAEKMGATEGQARRLANQLLELPKDKAINVTTPGMKQALADLREAHRLLRFGTVRLNISSQAGKNQQEPRLATGGLLSGPGSGTSDSILMWGSSGEFMQRKRAVDYYGVDYMRRLNDLQVPRYAGGGSIGAAPVSSGAPLGSEVHGVLRISPDGTQAWIDGVARSAVSRDAEARHARARAASIGGMP